MSICLIYRKNGDKNVKTSFSSREKEISSYFISFKPTEIYVKCFIDYSVSNVGSDNPG